MKLDEPTAAPISPRTRKGWIRSEDWLAVLLGGIVLVVSLAASAANPAKDFDDRLAAVTSPAETIDKAQAKKRNELAAGLYVNPLKPYVSKIGAWKQDPSAAFMSNEKSTVPGIIGVFLICLALFCLGSGLRGEPVGQFAVAFTGIFALAVISFLLAGQDVIKYYNLEYALWALLTGMIISNTIGTPAFLRPAMRTELYIKTGLILLGAEVLLSRLLSLGLPGICVSWIVTPVVLISTYAFGQSVLRMPSRSLNMVISADMSVCGVSAAIATAAACRAKKEELSLAIGISLAFTAVMMVLMPAVIGAVGMDPVVAGAWLGGTIDSTGAVAAAGGMLKHDGDDTVLQVAVTVKMIQNILIGVVAFGVAVYWVTMVELDENSPRPKLSEIWQRFPRFVIGFVAASLVFSVIASRGPAGNALVQAVTGGTGETLRSWFFCLAFVSIGLETNFREFAQYLRDGKAVILYVCGQTLNLALSLAMSWLMFQVVFPQAAHSLK